MKVLSEVKNIQYEIFGIDSLDETALVVAEAFTRDEPITVSQDVPLEEFADFVRLLGPKAEQEELSIIARDKDTNEIIGALVADDFAALPPEGIGHLGEDFGPILAVLDAIDEQYKQGRRMPLGEYLRLFMGAVKQGHRGRKVGQNLIATCLENAVRKGYKTAVGEATSLISQYILRNKFGFVDRCEIRYKEFIYQGRQVFESIAGPTGIIFMDKALV